MPNQLTPYQWLAALLRDETPTLTVLEKNASEDDLWQAGLENGVLALASHKLTNSEATDSVSEAFKKRLHQHTLKAVASELSQEHELREAMSLLTDAGLPFLLMKGTPLSYTHYPQSYLRTRCDTDILFSKKEDAEEAWLQLKSIGYQRPNAVSGEFVSHEFSCFKSDKASAGLALDMHWKLSNAQQFARSFNFDELVTSASQVTGLGEKVLALGPVHALMLACMHRIAHKPEGLENRLIWLYDIHLLTSELSEKQWQEFVALTTEKELCGICLDGIEQTVVTFNTEIPQEVIRQLKEGASHERYSTEVGESRLTMEMANLRALPGWKERVGLIKERVFPDTNYMLEKYDTRHKVLLPYLYVRRAVEGVFKLFR